MHVKHNAAGLVVTLCLGVGATATAQTAAPSPSQFAASKWSADIGIGFDNSISGNINSGGIGTINGQAVVITKNTYDQVYGTGFTFRFGGGYKLDDVTEVRAMFTRQSLGADLTSMGDIGVSHLYGQYDPYKYFGLDVGLRRYAPVRPKVQAYGEAAIGLGWIAETDVVLVAPTANLTKDATDFYDRTAAFTISGNVGLLVQTSNRVGVYAQLGLRWVSGMSAVDGLVGTGLETINDKSGRWTLPFMLGARVGFGSK